MGKLREGFTPAETEDKWFVVFSDDALWFHRSWTGFCIYRVRFEERLQRHFVTDVIVNRQPEQYRNSDDAVDVRTLNALLDSLLR
jgi:8-oxo-dGTP diphosphatase